MERIAECPYCSKAIAGIEPGEHRCSRCSGVFRISSSYETSRIRRSWGWLAVMHFGWMVIIVVGIAGWFARGSHFGMEVVTPLFLIAFFVTFVGGILHAVCTGEIPLGKRSTYREDGAVGFYVCLSIAAVAAALSLVVALKLVLEGLGE